MNNILIVGAGCCGASAARSLAELGWHVTVVDRRSHVAGNVYDARDKNGFLYHAYGPHIFFTNDNSVWKFIHSFAEWDSFRCTLQVQIEGKYFPMPFQPSVIQGLIPETGKAAIQEIQKKWKNCKSVSVLELLNSKEPLIRKVGQRLYECDCKPYNEKQWGLRPEQLLPEVVGRAPVFLEDQKQFRQEKYQYMPKNGFTALFKQMLNHPAIEILLNTESSELFNIRNGHIKWANRKWDAVLYSGRLDQLFEYADGVLPYRSLHFDYQYLPEEKGLPSLAVYYPEKQFRWTRRTDYRYLPGAASINGKTLVIGECPVPIRSDQDEPYYVVLTKQSSILHQQYTERLKAVPHIYAAGRLAEFRYYNMDMAIRRGMDIAEQIDRQERSI